MSSTTDFQSACAAPENVRQQAVSRAREGHRVARQAELLVWENARKAAEARFALVKHDASHPDHDGARAALDALQTAPDGRRLRDMLDAEIRQADAGYHAAVAALRAEHGISRLA